jgi:uncharacterized protein
MKVELEKAEGVNVVTAYGVGYVRINIERHEANLILMPDRIMPWAATGFDTLQVADFETLRELGAEIVLLGTGARQRFPTPALLRPLIEARIGCEVMDLAAACRTYNILATEGRHVAAALLIE